MVAAQCHKKVNPTAKKRPELREPAPPADGGMVTHFRCKECEFTRLKPIFHKNCARHCHDYHKGGDVDAGDKNDDARDKNGASWDGHGRARKINERTKKRKKEKSDEAIQSSAIESKG